MEKSDFEVNILKLSYVNIMENSEENKTSNAMEN